MFFHADGFYLSRMMLFGLQECNQKASSKKQEKKKMFLEEVAYLQFVATYSSFYRSIRKEGQKNQL